MSSRLDRKRGWERLAVQCDYRVEEMARRCNVSTRQLERHFLAVFKTTPKRWLDEVRAHAALQAMARGESVKATATDLKFKHASNFTRFFKRVKGATPTKFKWPDVENR
jgi:AraC-like DNA-binding protein